MLLYNGKKINYYKMAMSASQKNQERLQIKFLKTL